MQMTSGLDETVDATYVGGLSADRQPSGGRRSQPPTMERGTLVGRYVVLSTLGSGAMGVVLVAYDPELDRKVALKLLRPRGHDRAEHRSRLQREAQALARLNHPNVVTVHDVGTHEGQVFIAMELVQGRTLRQWMDAVDGPRPWREVVRVFEAAGRGLVAAHAAELIHRDFKPDNVMLGDEGRVRVMDFGLARADSSDDRVSEAPPPSLGSSSQESLALPLTQTGAMMGTPAYMAPEQFAGTSVTAHSDQFGFCVSLYEALYGQRPFEGEQVVDLAASVASGEVREPPRGSRVPAWLRAVVLRGLRPDPRERHRSVEDLLRALGYGEVRRRRSRWLVAGSIFAVVVAAAIGGQRYGVARRTAECEAAGRAIDEVWNEDSRTALREGLVASGASFAPVVAEKVMPWVDDYAETWREHATDACMRATVHETWDADTLDRAQWCLEERRQQLTTLVSELTTADDQVARRAVHTAAGLPSLVTCVDQTTLAAMARPPEPALRPQVEAVRTQLSRARTLELAGKYDDGLAVAREARAEAEDLKWPPLVAAALDIEASLLGRTAAYEEAETVGVEAYMDAVSSEAWDVAAAAASNLAFVIGDRRARRADGKIWAEHARVAIEKAGDPAGLREAIRLNSLGNLYLSMGEVERARELHEQVLALRREALGPEHPSVATAMNNLGNVYYSLDDEPRALELYEQALEIREQTLGPEHPFVAASLNNLGVIFTKMDQPEKAQALYERSLGIAERARGPDHPEVGQTLVNLASVRQLRGEPEPARDLYLRAMAVLGRALGPEHPATLQTAIGLATARSALGEHAEIIEELGPLVSSPAVEELPEARRADAMMLLGKALWAQSPPGSDGRRRGRAMIEKARAILEGAGDSWVGRLAEARAWLDEHPPDL